MSATDLDSRHDRWQDALLGAGYAGLLGMVLGTAHILPPTLPWEQVGSALRLIGWISFVVIWFRLARLVRDDETNLLTAPVVDDRVRAVRGEALYAALTAVLLLQLVIILGHRAVPLRPQDTAELTVAVALVTALSEFRRRVRR